MTISSLSGAPARGSDAADAVKQNGAGSVAESKQQLNMSIVRASFEVSLSAHNEPLALLYKSAIANLNEVLKPQFGENAIQNAAAQDNTPAGTAGRIVALSTAFFEAFKKQHPGEDEAVVLQKFMDTIRSGMEKGFAEARNILQGLGTLNGDIAANIDKTYELVTKGYADFEAAQKAPAPKDEGSVVNS